jgi:putative nucleotidyltransferase with HDIG domain
MIAGKDDLLSNNEYYSELVSSLYSLAAAIDVKDHYTFYHSCNVAAYAAAIGKAYGLDYFHCDTIYQAGLIHDIGKIGISEAILNKPGALTDDEYEIIKHHVDNSVEIVKYSPVLKRLIPIIYSHHERWDGGGYPRGLESKKIPIESRCLSVADAFDSMVTDRPYRPAMTVEQTLKILEKEKWKQLDGDLVDIFIEMVQKKRVKLNLVKDGREYAIIRNVSV